MTRQVLFSGEELSSEEQSSSEITGPSAGSGIQLKSLLPPALKKKLSSPPLSIDPNEYDDDSVDLDGDVVGNPVQLGGNHVQLISDPVQLGSNRVQLISDPVQLGSNPVQLSNTCERVRINETTLKKKGVTRNL
jgi:hypothetical protein